MGPARGFTPDQVARYARHLILPEVGGAGQRKLLSSSVLLHGSIFRFEGRLALFDSSNGTGCYRCLFPEPPPPGSVQSCAEAGVFGALPGIIGSMMAFETIKYLLDIGRPMIGRYLLFEGEDMTFRELKLRQNKACPLCGENPTVRSLIDYEAW